MSIPDQPQGETPGGLPPNFWRHVFRALIWAGAVIGIAALFGLGATMIPSHPSSGVANVQASTTTTAHRSGSVTVTVDGTKGLAFTGNVGSVGSSRSVEGVVPATYSVATTGIAVAVMQKKSGGTELLVVNLVCVDGTNNLESTAAAYGGVTVSCP